MDQQRFDDLIRSFVAATNRRTALGGLVAATGSLALAVLADRTEAKRRRKKKKRCKGGKKRCGRTCCLPAQGCTGKQCQCAVDETACGALCCDPTRFCDPDPAPSCPCKTPCGQGQAEVCCLDGQACVDQNTAECGCNGSTCLGACNCGDTPGGERFCFAPDDEIDCQALRGCDSNADCPAGSACSLDLCAAVCGPGACPGSGAACIPFCGA